MSIFIILQGFEVQEQCNSNIIENAKFFDGLEVKRAAGREGGTSNC